MTKFIIAIVLTFTAFIGTANAAKITTSGNTVTLTGAINGDDPWELMDILQNNKEITTIVINSQGGWVKSGIAMGNMIKHFKLKVVAKYAVSAAGLMAIADANFEGTALLHAPHFNGKFVVGGSEALSLSSYEMDQYMTKMGLTQAMADEVLESTGNKFVKVTKADIK